MKNILLLGDSIRMGYDKSVRKTLEGKANVYFPSDCCRFASYLLRYLYDYKSLIKDENVDVVHWNAGLWDCLRLFEDGPHVPIEIYALYIERICKRMKLFFPNAKIIFATSTKVQSEKMPKEVIRYNEDIIEYNKVAVEIVKKYGFAVNDLYAVSDSLPEEAHSDPTHYYTTIGTEAFTNAVLKHIKEALELDEELIYKEELYTAKPIGI